MVINAHNDDESKPGAGDCRQNGVCSTDTGGNEPEKSYPTAAVRYGYLKTVGEFKYPAEDLPFSCGVPVVIQTNRGIEIGETVAPTCEERDKHISREQIRAYVQASGVDYYRFGNGKILRLATKEDLADWERIRAETLHKTSFCQERAKECQLPMKVLECEHLFGGERIIFYFMAEGRIDFRTLVRGLAEEFQTRIEMRQVGARDEARLLADYETCGRECCCRNFLKTLKPISMKMAKMQKATLDPAKVSGRCGRLKCCLRYEHTTYEELHCRLPSLGARIVTESGSGAVVARQILTQLVQIQTEDGGRLTVPVEDILDEEELARREAEKAKAAQAAAAAAAAEAARRSEPASPKEDSRPARGRSRRARRPRKKPITSGTTRRQTPKKKDAGAESTSEAGTPPTTAEARDSQPAADSKRGTTDDAPKGENGKGEGSKRRRRRGRRSSRRRGVRKAKGEGDSSPPAS